MGKIIFFLHLVPFWIQLGVQLHWHGKMGIKR